MSRICHKGYRENRITMINQLKCGNAAQRQIVCHLLHIIIGHTVKWCAINYGNTVKTTIHRTKNMVCGQLSVHCGNTVPCCKKLPFKTTVLVQQNRS